LATAVDRTVFDAALKDLYLGPIREQVNRATVLLDIIGNRKGIQVVGKQYIVPLITQRHAGIVTRSGATRSANKLPTAHTQTYARATYQMKWHYGRIEVDGPSMRSSKTDKGAFASALDAEIKGLTTSFPQEMNRQLHGNGMNKIAQPTVNGANTVNMTVSSTKFLHPGQPITFITNSDGTIEDQSTVSSITSATAVVLTTAATWTAATSGVYPESESTTVTSYGGAMNGLAGIISTSNPATGVYLGGINRTTGTEYWNAISNGNGGTSRPLSIGLIQDTLLDCELNRYGGKRPTHIISDGDMWNTHGNLLAADKRFRGETMTMDGGWQYLECAGIKHFYDKDAPANTLKFFNLEHLFYLTQTEPQWMEEDGSILYRIANYDSYEATLLCDKELATDLPSCMAELVDLDTNLA
jgi:hypothetical protein